ncbi:MAG: hypothetical protein KF886_19920 [Candidatus Hydrogenedentes bacterium]|nr:hypothetical protein [Candidatus Hydrogenedentota bacterium]
MLPVLTGFIAVLLATTQDITIPPVDPDAPPAVHVTIDATLPDGTPAVEIPVYEVGLERGYIRYGKIGKTDAAGRFTVPFHRGREVDHTKPRGYGLYRYVLMPPAHRMEISDFYCWNEYPEGGPAAQRGGFGYLSTYDDWFAPHYNGELEATDPADNWSYGKGVALYTGRDLTWPVRLDVGKTVELTVLDQDGLYIPDKELNVGIDLRARTRTGVGGDIPITRIRTNGKGVARLDHIGDFAYNIATVNRDGDVGRHIAPNASYYRSDIDHNFVKQGTTIRFKRVDPIYLQFQVRDAATGGAIAGATITPSYQFAAFSQTGFSVGTTRESEDTLTVEFCEPLEHVSWFEATAPGYELGRRMMDKYKAGEVIEILLNRVREDDRGVVR